MSKPQPHQHEDKKLEDLIDKDKPLSNKKLKTLALNESKFTDKSYQDKLKEFKDDKKVRPISKKYNLYADNKAKEKLADKVNQKSRQPTAKPNLEGSKSGSSGQGVEQMGKSLKGALKGLQGGSIGGGSVPGGGGGGASGSNGGSKEELYSSIKDLEQQLFSFPPIAERTPEQHKQIAQIEAQIGDLKAQLKKIEEQEKEGNLSVSSANSSNGSQGGKQETKKPKQPKTAEEKEEALLDDKAEKMNEVLNKEDKIKDGSSSKKLSTIQKEFNKDHKNIVNEISQGQQQQLTIGR